MTSEEKAIKQYFEALRKVDTAHLPSFSPTTQPMRRPSWRSSLAPWIVAASALVLMVAIGLRTPQHHEVSVPTLTLSSSTDFLLHGNSTDALSSPPEFHITEMEADENLFPPSSLEYFGG